jgi:2-keto-3-deoxy-L-rhamnonate aldolase RhmA
VKAANEATLVAAQIEDREAVENLDALLQVEGIDVFFLGPSDLSQSMGHPGNPKAPPVASAIEQSLAKMRAAGRTPGMPASAENVREALARGVRYLYTHLPRLVAGSAKEYLRNARG